ncbi:MAG: hypothetical protein HQK51_16060 [Oligoflexia bacterium]|nr:hypothetical protein [Oligoflexia bacterium]
MLKLTKIGIIVSITFMSMLLFCAFLLILVHNNPIFASTESEPVISCQTTETSLPLSLEKLLVAESVSKIQKQTSVFLNNPFNLDGTNKIAACPLISVKYADVLAKLAVIDEKLKGTKCKDENKQIFTDLQQTIKDVDGYMIKSNESRTLKTTASTADAVPAVASEGATSASTSATITTPTLATKAQNYGKTIGNAVDVLARIAGNEQCMYNINERGILPVLADVVVNFSQLALLFPGPVPGVPNPNSFMVAGGGIALGSILKILNSLFANPFDWSKVDERKQFVDLVCTFYNTRIELKKMQFFRQKTKGDELILKQAKDIEKNIASEVNKLEEARSLEVIKIMGGESNRELFTQLPAIIQKLAGPVESENTENAMSSKDKDKYDQELADYKAQLPTLLEEVKDKIAKLKIDPEKNPALKDLLPADIKKFITLDPKNAKDLYSKSPREIKEYLVPSLRRLLSFLKFEASNAEKNVMDKHKNYEDALKSLNDLKGKITEFVLTFDTIVNEKTYSPYGDGTFNKQAILNSIKSNSDQLFGDVGWSFVNYVLAQADSIQRNFNSRYNKLYKKYLDFTVFIMDSSKIDKKTKAALEKKKKKDSKKSESVKKEELRRLCSTIDDLRKDFQNSEALTEMATDFLDSIKDISHNNTGTLKTFLLVIPRGFTAGNHLLKQHQSLVEFRDKEEKSTLKEGDTNPVGVGTRFKLWWRKNKVGAIAETNEELRVKSDRMREFYLAKHCDELLYISEERI